MVPKQLGHLQTLVGMCNGWATLETMTVSSKFEGVPALCPSYFNSENIPLHTANSRVSVPSLEYMFHQTRIFLGALV